MYLWVFRMKPNCRIHRQHSLHLHPITISMKNCQFAYATHRTLSFFMCIGVKWRGKIAETRKTCTHEYFSWKPIVWFMSNSLSSFGPSHFLWKISSFLTQHIGVSALYGILAWKWSGETSSTCKHVHMRPSHETESLDSREPLKPSPANHLADAKLPVSLHNNSDFE